MTTEPAAGQPRRGADLLSHSHWSGQIYDGRWIAGSGGALTVIEKATGDSLGVVGVATAGDVDSVTRTARAAQAGWGAATGGERARVLRSAATLVEDHAEELLGWLIRESGAIASKSRGELDLAVAELHEAAALATQPHGVILTTPEDRPSYARRVPVGLVAVIAPWNGPFLLAMRAVAPALALGNAVLIKPDPQTPVSGGVLLAEVFRAAGLPAGVLSVLPGGDATGEALVRQDGIGMVCFTGSTQAGRKVGEIAGGLLKRVSLELGGNNAYVVLADADVPRAVEAAVFGAFFHQGQICMTAGRHIVHERVADEYADLLVERTRKLTMGDPYRRDVDMGPMINGRQVARGAELLRASVRMGARLLIGGSIDGLFFQPAVLSEVTAQMPVFTEERFAPIAPITSVRSDAEAIALANRTEYGLTATVHSRDIAHALAVAEHLQAGMTHINDQGIMHEVTAPMGGLGASGNGSRYGSLTNLDEFTQWRWLTMREQAPGYPLHGG
jgi:benzaldehyde dehydrogenase (NAD)